MSNIENVAITRDNNIYMWKVCNHCHRVCMLNKDFGKTNSREICNDCFILMQMNSIRK